MSSQLVFARLLEAIMDMEKDLSLINFTSNEVKLKSILLDLL